MLSQTFLGLISTCVQDRAEAQQNGGQGRKPADEGPSAANDKKVEDSKTWARMRAKVNRLCGMTQAGKLQVSEDIHKLFMKGGQTKMR